MDKHSDARDPTAGALASFEADLEPFPSPVPAANGRSPNRKPRMRKVLKLWDVTQAKKLFLRVYRLTGDSKIACERVDRHPATVWRWAKDDPAFESAIDHIAAQWVDLLDRNLKNLDLKAIEVIRDTLEQSTDLRLRAEIAVKVLKSHGYMPDKATLEHTGPGGGPVTLIHTVEVQPPDGIEGA